MSSQTTPASPAEAEELAKKAVAEYLNACRLTGRDQIGNYLMKLCSVSAVLMAHSEGSASAVHRLEATAEFIDKTMPAQPAQLATLQ